MFTDVIQCSQCTRTCGVWMHPCLNLRSSHVLAGQLTAEQVELLPPGCYISAEKNFLCFRLCSSRQCLSCTWCGWTLDLAPLVVLLCPRPPLPFRLLISIDFLLWLPLVALLALLVLLAAFVSLCSSHFMILLLLWLVEVVSAACKSYSIHIKQTSKTNRHREEGMQQTRKQSGIQKTQTKTKQQIPLKMIMSF